MGITAALLALVGSANADQLQDGLIAYHRGDYQIAKRAFEPIAEQGDANAQVMLGLMFTKGQGVERDIDAALNWFKQAADNPKASGRVLEDAAYNRDFILRKMKERDEAEARAQAATDAAAAQQLHIARAAAAATAAAQQASQELEEKRLDIERDRLKLLKQEQADRRRRHEDAIAQQERMNADQAQRDANNYEVRQRAQSKGSFSFR
ncbi:SEL1-like repeat protein [Bradyrhizobium sp. AUGA SZCCT0169]|uniref:SEL1-like repeat protein n=1 Tax=Bradyrhizobium sp. AUGA SZCCT0169 TaxID=2807663 RepID=UPI001BA52AF9|nr:SEL1-like repeat protein [Bradyrhizobium sp. AUGA SZCCT0169]MBR1246137.1 SEL1-like repeat protein [Bradyrhizobium sp. AUGA SZCCT0169]